jgi:glycosylphosphatidylinositol transamidase (GPIT) subunit GPI8
MLDRMQDSLEQMASVAVVAEVLHVMMVAQTALMLAQRADVEVMVLSTSSTFQQSLSHQHLPVRI